MTFIVQDAHRHRKNVHTAISLIVQALQFVGWSLHEGTISKPTLDCFRDPSNYERFLRMKDASVDYGTLQYVMFAYFSTLRVRVHKKHTVNIMFFFLRNFANTAISVSKYLERNSGTMFGNWAVNRLCHVYRNLVSSFKVRCAL